MSKRFQKGLLIALLLFVSLSTPLFAQTNNQSNSNTNPNSTEPVPYDPSEFPEGVNDLRRFEQIMIGSFPISILFSQLLGGLGLFVDDALYSQGNSQFKFGAENYRVDDKIRIIGAGVGISFGIALIDMIIYQTKKNDVNNQYHKKRVLSLEEKAQEVENAGDSTEGQLDEAKGKFPIDNTFSDLISPEPLVQPDGVIAP